jgi:hypothetical protein
MPCPADTTRIEPGAVCFPEGVDVERCRDLEGLPCSGPDWLCDGGMGCGRDGCVCRMSLDAGAYTWDCRVVAC